MIRRDRLVVLLLVTLAWACSGSKSPATSPSPTPSPTPPTTFALSGRVTDSSSSAPIVPAYVSIVDGPNAGKSTQTDLSGTYSLTGLQQSGFTVKVSATNYDSQSKGVALTSNQTLNFALQPQRPAVAFEVTGVATDDDRKPVADANVSFTFLAPAYSGSYLSASGATDGSGFYRVRFTAVLGGYQNDVGNGATAFAQLAKSGYEIDNRFFRPTSQNTSQTLNFHTYRLRRITAGESTVVTVAPGDAICYNNRQDSPGWPGGADFVCRTVEILAPTDGVMIIQALPTQSGGGLPGLEIEVSPASGPCLDGCMSNPVSTPVTVGTIVSASVEMAASSTVSQSFVVNTSMSVR